VLTTSDKVYHFLPNDDSSNITYTTWLTQNVSYCCLATQSVDRGANDNLDNAEEAAGMWTLGPGCNLRNRAPLDYKNKN